MCNVLISIKPVYLRLILQGKKKVELRKRFPKEVHRVFLYETAPIKQVRYFFVPTTVEFAAPNTLWPKVRDICGLSHEEYNKYFSSVAIGIFFDKVKRIKPVTLDQIPAAVPQNFIYLDNNQVNTILNHSLET